MLRSGVEADDQPDRDLGLDHGRSVAAGAPLTLPDRSRGQLERGRLPAVVGPRDGVPLRVRVHVHARWQGVGVELDDTEPLERVVHARRVRHVRLLEASPDTEVLPLELDEHVERVVVRVSGPLEGDHGRAVAGCGAGFRVYAWHVLPGERSLGRLLGAPHEHHACDEQ